MKTPFAPIVVMADVHGRPEISRAIARHYETADNSVKFVTTGDRVGGPDTFGVLEQERKMGVTQVFGNWEWPLMAMMGDKNPDNRAEWMNYYIDHGYDLDSIFKSYDVSVTSSLAKAVEELKSNMMDAKHFQHLNKGVLAYVGTGPRGPYAVTHAGFTPTVWPQQDIQLRMRNQDRLAGNYGTVAQKPAQVFGHRVMKAADVTRQKKERGVQYPINVRGHYHDSQGRAIQARGKIINLATDIKNDPNAPIRVYEAASDLIVEVPLK